MHRSAFLISITNAKTLFDLSCLCKSSISFVPVERQLRAQFTRSYLKSDALCACQASKFIPFYLRHSRIGQRANLWSSSENPVHLGQPVEIAPLYVLLASQESSYVTGEVYGATGGLEISSMAIRSGVRGFGTSRSVLDSGPHPTAKQRSEAVSYG